MPNRILRDITDSEKVNLLSSQAEVLFYRLMMKADDYGVFHAKPSLIKAALFPLRLDTVRETDISRWLTECEKAGLIAFYDAEAKPFLVIINFGQRMRNMKKRFPSPPNDLTASCRDLPPETKEKQKRETETKDVDDARENFLSFKSVLMQDEHYRQTCCVSSKINDDQFEDAIGEYFEKKVALREYEGMTRKDVRKNFMYWLSGWLERQRKPQQQNAKAQQNGKSKLQNLIAVNQEVKNSFDGIDD